MKKVLFGLFISLVLSLNVFAEEIYEMSRIDLGDTDYEPIIFEEKVYLLGDDYDCSETNCNLYFINEKNEIEKANKMFEKVKVSTDYREHLDKKPNEDGSYDLYSYTHETHTYTLVSDTIDVSNLFISEDKDEFAYYYEEKSSTNNNTIIYQWKIYYFLVQDKDNKIAIYDAKGKQYLDFGDYTIMARVTPWDDSNYDSVEKIVLKNNDDQSYVFIGADQKVVTLTKEMADKIGINDENVLTINYEIGNYYSFTENYETMFFTLTDGLLNTKGHWNGHPSIKRYNNQYIIEELVFYDGAWDMFNLLTLDGNPIIESEKYNHIYYFDNYAEIILAVDEYSDVVGLGEFKKSVIDIHDGEKVVYSKELEIGDRIIDALIDEGNIWIVTDDGEFKAIYILRKTKNDPTVEPEPTIKNPEPTPEKDPEPEENNSCKKVDGKYYDKSGKETTKEQHEKECLENPDTGYVIPFMGVLILIGGYVIIKNKKQLLKKI